MDLTVGSYNFVVEENPNLPVKDMRFAAPDIGWISILQRQRKIERARATRWRRRFRADGTAQLIEDGVPPD